MKPSILFIVFIVGITQVSGQTIEYSEVVKVDSLLVKDELFSRARSWFVDTFKDAKEVLQVSDRESGELQGNGLFKFNYNVLMSFYSAEIDYKVSVTIKDGRYKARVYQFNNPQNTIGINTVNGYGEITPIFIDKNSMANGTFNKKSYEKLLPEIDTYSKALLLSLKAYMNKPTTKEEDW